VPLRVVFCGTPEFAVPPLRYLIEQSDFQVEAVVTQPDRPRGRGGEVSASAVNEAALGAGIAVYQPEKIRSESAVDFFTRVKPEVVVIIAYGQIIPARLLEMPRLGWVNLHASLLPKYRGAAPINWAIANGEARTGLTTMQVEAGLDTGPMLLKKEFEIGADETAPELARRLSEAGGPMVAETLRGLERGELKAEKQDDSQATLAPILKREDGRIDWRLRARVIYNRMRGFQPWPGAYSGFRGKICHVWGTPHEWGKPAEAGAAGEAREVGTILERGGETLVVCGDRTALRVEAVQLEGRKRVTGREFAQGARLAGGEKFGD
jgi:methionyl-tRNA formyltransferase